MKSLDEAKALAFTCREVGKRLKGCLRENDIVARLGGENADHWVLICDPTRTNAVAAFKRLAVDLVILNERGSSYVQDLQNAIEAALRSSQYSSPLSASFSS